MEEVVICSVQFSTLVALWVLEMSATLIVCRYKISVALIPSTHNATRVEDCTEQITTSSIKYPSRSVCHLTIKFRVRMDINRNRMKQTDNIADLV